MLEQVILRNFQAHKNLTIKFDPAITSIIGSSDIGKSAVLRALRWVCLNKGTLRALRRRRSKYTKVLLTVDGKTVTRTRGKSNKYKVDGKAYKAIGTNVPAAVQQMLNCSEINFQLQHDAPFWFSKSSGQVSKELNQIVNLGLIDKVLGTVAGRLRTARATVEVSEQRLVAAKASKQELGWVSDMEKAYRLLCLKEQSLSRQVDRIEQLEDLLQATAQAIVLTKQSFVILTDLRHCEELLTDHQGLKHDVKALEGLLSSISQEESRLCQLREKQKEKESELQRRLKGKCPLCGKLLTRS